MAAASNNDGQHELQCWYDRIKHTIMKKTKVKASTGCLIWGGCKKKIKNTSYGVISFQIPGSRKRTMKNVHRVAYMAHTGDLNLPRECDVSHLCQNSLCVCPQHLSLEPRSINNQRKLCKRSKQCQGHGIYQDCLL